MTGREVQNTEATFPKKRRARGGPEAQIWCAGHRATLALTADVGCTAIRLDAVITSCYGRSVHGTFTRMPPNTVQEPRRRLSVK